MVISCSTSQKDEKECMWVKYLIFAVLLRFQRGGGPLVISHNCQVNLLVNLGTNASYSLSS